MLLLLPLPYNNIEPLSDYCRGPPVAYYCRGATDAGESYTSTDSSTDATGAAGSSGKRPGSALLWMDAILV